MIVARAFGINRTARSSSCSDAEAGPWESTVESYSLRVVVSLPSQYFGASSFSFTFGHADNNDPGLCPFAVTGAPGAAGFSTS